MIKNKILKNASWIIAGRIVQAVLNLLITMLTARFLGPSNFGLIGYASSIIAFATPIMQLGITSILVQELILEPEKEGETLGTALISCFCSGLLSVAGVMAFALIANRGEPETIIVCALYSLTLLVQSLECINYWFQTHLLSKYSSIISLVAYVVVAAYKAYLLFAQKEVYWFALSNALDFLLIGIASLAVYRKIGGSVFSFSFASCKRMIHRGKYYIISGLMITAFSQTDRIMLKLMVDNSAAGFYSAAVNCAGMAGFVANAIIDSARPVIFESKKTSEANFEKNMIRLYSVVIYFALAQSVGITLLAKPIVYIIYGQAYQATIPALQIIVWYTTFAYIGSVRNIWMLAETKQHLIWRIDVSGALANVMLNAILIPRFGVNGAAIASLVTQMFTNVIIVAVMKETRPNIMLMGKSLNPKRILGLLK